MYLDQQTSRMLAAERAALLRHDMGSARRNHQPARRRVGLWLAGLGLRLAGQAAGAQTGAERGSLTVPPHACL